MKDFGSSSDPAVQAQLDRLAALSVPQGRLGLDTVRALLSRLGDPHLALPPVFHVAGTNGKGSTCAFLRAMLEAQGLRVHATTSPHLVRYNERIRVAGELIGDARLAALLQEVLDAGEDLAPSFFEVTIAAAFAEFARVPADACVVEVGLGGRFDATNVIPAPAACGIAALGIDHERFLLAPEDGTPTRPLARIAFEKAGIAKSGVPLVTQAYPGEAAEEVVRAAQRAGASLAMRGRDWQARLEGKALRYSDSLGTLTLPLPALAGPHQPENAALAVAMLRHQDAVRIDAEALASGIRTADWPARLQRLAHGPLAGAREVWLDGGHNPSAGAILAEHFAGQRLHLILGMIAGKDPSALTGPLSDNLASLTVVPVPGHDHHPPEAFGGNARAAPDVPSALAAVPGDGLPVLIAGSLYLAGEVLRLNGEWPD
ncbi:folylpolyglutamate synthase/dihydrofolate synthase family protein [Pelagerythrobacter marensis]|uniref:Folylpolyglutamate synthase/dihydrofolate synthase family protein n=1 Tax=Pelagerythrobacter marensis TaxID=543877 RepID=A0ABZ2D6H7_9SPHN